MLNVIPVILCGGKGTRLWPLSRHSYPKQFLSLYGDNGDSLMQQTYKRISELSNVDDPIIICNEDHRFLVAEQMRKIGVKPKAIILENEGRNTAPAIAICAICNSCSVGGMSPASLSAAINLSSSLISLSV